MSWLDVHPRDYCHMYSRDQKGAAVLYLSTCIFSIHMRLCFTSLLYVMPLCLLLIIIILFSLSSLVILLHIISTLLRVTEIIIIPTEQLSFVYHTFPGLLNCFINSMTFSNYSFIILLIYP